MATYSQEKAGQLAYEGYCISTDNKDYLGNHLPEWKQLSNDVRRAWMAAGEAVRDYFNNFLIEFQSE